MHNFDAEKEKDAVRVSFCKRLKTLREEIGVSQEEFAKAMGVSRAAIGYYENGERLPDIAFVQVVSKRTGCSLDYLLNGGNKIRASDKILDIVKLDNTQYETLINLLYCDSFTQVLSNPAIYSLFNNIDWYASFGIPTSNPLIALLVEQAACRQFGPIINAAFTAANNSNRSNYDAYLSPEEAKKARRLDHSEDSALLDIIEAFQKAHDEHVGDRINKSYNHYSLGIPAVRSAQREPNTTIEETDKIEKYRLSLEGLGERNYHE